MHVHLDFAYALKVLNFFMQNYENAKFPRTRACTKQAKVETNPKCTFVLYFDNTLHSSWKDTPLKIHQLLQDQTSRLTVYFL